MRSGLTARFVGPGAKGEHKAPGPTVLRVTRDNSRATHRAQHRSEASPGQPPCKHAEGPVISRRRKEGRTKVTTGPTVQPWNQFRKTHLGKSCFKVSSRLPLISKLHSADMQGTLVLTRNPTGNRT